jgi:hypothetical protein
MIGSPPHDYNTRYEWLVRPYSIGTCTQSETPGLLGAPKSVHCGEPTYLRPLKFRFSGVLFGQPDPRKVFPNGEQDKARLDPSKTVSNTTPAVGDTLMFGLIMITARRPLTIYASVL